MIYPCNCSHNQQDEMYGKGNRVHNPCKPAKLPVKWIRCTVCRKEKQI